MLDAPASVADTAFVGSTDAAASFGPELASIDAFAKGAIFAGGVRPYGRLAGLDAYENQIVDHPVLFSFAKGATIGRMGEAGPEAIMPLSRGADGKLGLSGGGSTVHNWHISTPNPDAFLRSSRQIQAHLGTAMARTQQRNSL